MVISGRVSPRRLTGKEEQEIVAATARIEAARAEVDRRLGDRDRLVFDIVQEGARVADIASVLGVTRATVYAILERARQK